MEKKWKILSSAHGALNEIFLVVDNLDFYEPFLRALCLKLPAHTRFSIWLNQPNLETKLSVLLGENHKFRFCFFQQGSSFSPWVQDAFLVLQHQQKATVKLLTTTTTQLANRNLAKGIQENSRHGHSFQVEKVDWFVMDGGNILIGDDFCLIGENDFFANFRNLDIKTKKRLYLDEKKGISFTQMEMAKLLDQDRKIVVVGAGKGSKAVAPSLSSIWDKGFWTVGEESYPTVSTWMGKSINPKGNSGQGEIHIDLFMTLAGRLNDQAKEPYVLILGEPVNLVNSDNLQPQKEVLKLIVEKLETAGFLVKRNPIPIVRNHRGRIIQAFYNNCLVEIVPGKKTVWLPKYNSQLLEADISIYEAENVALWKSLGFRVEFIEADFVTMAERGGALHCLTKCLARG